MPLAPGTRLGPYEILASIGGGGMGDVYKARDTRLERVVALKILRGALEGCAEWQSLLARFEHEARAISSLNHPHICALYDVGKHEHIDYLVMEYVQGETLSDVLAKGPLPLEQALRCAIQVADAVEQAHRRGIVHRDLKPGNIMVTKTGAKLLDFGLAKTAPVIKSGSDATATLTAFLTSEGAIVGTLQYMAPEQLEGKNADERSDIFAFGAVLYEMLTGRRAFNASSQAGVIAATLHTEPPLVSVVNPNLPPSLDRLVRKCLAKDPQERWQSAHDLKDELDWISRQGFAAPTVTAPSPRSRRLAWIAVGVLLGMAAYLPWAFRVFSSAPPRVMRLSVAGLESVTTEDQPAISPDGKYLAFMASAGAADKPHMVLRAPDSLAIQPVPGSDNGEPIWAPDSRSIAFAAGGVERKLKRFDLASGTSRTICDLPGPGSTGAWSRDGTILVTTQKGFYHVPAAGGNPTQVTALDVTAGEITHRYPQFLPDGRHFLYVAVNRNYSDSKVYVGSLDSTSRQPLVSASSRPVYASGHLLFARGDTLWAQPFDVKSLRLSGEPRALTNDVINFPGNAYTLFSASETGVLAYSRQRPPEIGLFWLDRNGKQVSAFGGKGSARISPDQRHVVVMSGGTVSELWLGELDRGTLSPLGLPPASRFRPAWSPDSTHIAYFRHGGAGSDCICSYSLGSPGQEEVLLPMNGTDLFYPQSWSPDGSALLYLDATQRTLNVLPLSGERKPRLLIKAPEYSDGGIISPDGHWFAYFSGQSGRREVYLQSFPEPGSKQQVSTSGSSRFFWTRNGREILYQDLAGKVISVPVELGNQPKLGAPHELFALPKDASVEDVSANGERFLTAIGVTPGDTRRFVLVLNWPEALKK